MSTFRGANYCKIKMPLVWGDRVMIGKQCGFFDEEKKIALVSMKSLKQPKFFGTDVPVPAKGEVVMDVNYGYNYYEYLGPQKTRITGIFNINMKMGGIPDGFMDYLLKSMGLTELENSKKFAMSIDSTPFGSRIK